MHPALVYLIAIATALLPVLAFLPCARGGFHGSFRLRLTVFLLGATAFLWLPWLWLGVSRLHTLNITATGLVQQPSAVESRE